MNIFWFTLGMITVMIALTICVTWWMYPVWLKKMLFKIKYCISRKTFQQQRYDFIKRIEEEGYKEAYIENIEKMIKSFKELSETSVLITRDIDRFYAEHVYDWIFNNEEK